MGNMSLATTPFVKDRCVNCGSPDTFKTYYGFRCNGCGKRNYVIETEKQWIITTDFATVQRKLVEEEEEPQP